MKRENFIAVKNLKKNVAIKDQVNCAEEFRIVKSAKLLVLGDPNDDAS